MQQQLPKSSQIQQQPDIKNQDLNRVVLKLAKFLFQKNLLEQFKKQHSGEKRIITNIQGQLEKPIGKKKLKKKRKSEQEQQLQESLKDNQTNQQISEILPLEVQDKRWVVLVKNIEQFMKNEYYLHQNVYYKLKSASHTTFKFNFKLDVVNTRNNKRQQLIITKNKRIYWVSTTKVQIKSISNRYFVQISAGKEVYIDNPDYLNAIKKYWNKATFYAVVPMTIKKQLCPDILMIQFNY